MSLLFSEYSLFEKRPLALEDLRNGAVTCDRLVSGYNQSERVRSVFDAISAPKKQWLMFPEYAFRLSDHPSDHQTFVFNNPREDEYIQEYFERFPMAGNERLCIDTTGFIRPHLMFLMRLLRERGINKFDLIYSEPLTYARGDATPFSGETVTEVRQVCGFEGQHTPAVGGDFLIVGCGYDNKLLEHVANHKSKARKIQLFPFPALRPHMYQENRIRTQRSSEAFGKVVEIRFAPAYDPFVTAEVLSSIVQKHHGEIANLYLSPLATKPQVVGFALFYLRERQNGPTSIVFPFSDAYSQETSKGISHIWLYRVDYGI